MHINCKWKDIGNVANVVDLIRDHKRELSKVKGVYLWIHSARNELVYVGETTDLEHRFQEHILNSLGGCYTAFASPGENESIYDVMNKSAWNRPMDTIHFSNGCYLPILNGAYGLAPRLDIANDTELSSFLRSYLNQLRFMYIDLSENTDDRTRKDIEAIFQIKAWKNLCIDLKCSYQETLICKPGHDHLIHINSNNSPFGAILKTKSIRSDYTFEHSGEIDNLPILISRIKGFSDYKAETELPKIVKES